MARGDFVALRYSGGMQLPSLEQIREAQALIYGYMPATPQYRWPLLDERLRAEAWIKHENHTPVGAFKIRGALVYMDWLLHTAQDLKGVVAATRGNHGQGVAMAARRMGIPAIIVVPHGNSREKNRAMKAQGAELIEHGEDFQEALEYARMLAQQRALTMIDSFHERLVMGTATYALEFFEAAPGLETIYVPIGLGSSICGVAAARNALKLQTEIVGVVSSQAEAYALSFEQRRAVESPARSKLADGLSCRVPVPAALQVIWENVTRVVRISESQIAEAMRVYYQDTHNIAEGAGAAALAGAMLETPRGKCIGIVLTGANVDRDIYERVLAGSTA